MSFMFFEPKIKIETSHGFLRQGVEIIIKVWMLLEKQNQEK